MPSRRERQERRRTIGESAETLVCEHLRALGFEIVGRNVRVRRREIDVIARRGTLLIFCEVRARTSDFVEPLATIGGDKVRRIREAAAEFILDRDIRGCAIRFDAAAVTYDAAGSGSVDYVPDAF